MPNIFSTERPKDMFEGYTPAEQEKMWRDLFLPDTYRPAWNETIHDNHGYMQHHVSFDNTSADAKISQIKFMIYPEPQPFDIIVTCSSQAHTEALFNKLLETGHVHSEQAARRKSGDPIYYTCFAYRSSSASKNLQSFVEQLNAFEPLMNGGMVALISVKLDIYLSTEKPILPLPICLSTKSIDCTGVMCRPTVSFEAPVETEEVNHRWSCSII